MFLDFTPIVNWKEKSKTNFLLINFSLINYKENKVLYILFKNQLKFCKFIRRFKKLNKNIIFKKNLDILLII
jgi:hypothetical protein